MPEITETNVLVWKDLANGGRARKCQTLARARAWHFSVSDGVRAGLGGKRHGRSSLGARAGKLVDNTVCEAFNGSLRCECLTRHWFASLAEGQAILEIWQTDYNHQRPHSSLGHRTPHAFRSASVYLPRVAAAH